MLSLAGFCIGGGAGRDEPRRRASNDDTAEASGVNPGNLFVVLCRRREDLLWVRRSGSESDERMFWLGICGAENSAVVDGTQRKRKARPMRRHSSR